MIVSSQKIFRYTVVWEKRRRKQSRLVIPGQKFLKHTIVQGSSLTGSCFSGQAQLHPAPL